MRDRRNGKDRMMNEKIIWTIGHSTRSLNEFCDLLHKNQIQLLADIRLYPGSRRYPHFNKEPLEKSLGTNGIGYIHFPELGGRRTPSPDSHNTAWKVDAFRGYADYMETEPFLKGITRLIEVAVSQQTAYMCAEAPWWKCHRSLVSDYLKSVGWKVMHIMNEKEALEHPFTKPANVIGGKLSYSSKQLTINN